VIGNPTPPPEPPEPPADTEASPEPAADDDLAADEVSDDDDTSDEPKVRLSYRERRRESDALAELARKLVEMTPSQLDQVPLPLEVRAEIETCRGFRKGPRIRQLRRISQLVRRLDFDEVSRAATDAGHKQRGRAQRERVYETWRERLLSEGKEALTEFIDLHPMVDPQRLRQLLRQARRDPGSGKSKQALLSVLRLVREALESEADVERAAVEE